jgi:Fimbrial assembly protein (PilN)
MALPQQVINQLSQEPAATPGWSSGVVFFSGGLLVVTLLMYFFMTLVYEPHLKSEILNTQNQVVQLSQEISPDDQANLITFYSQISNLQSLLQDHVLFGQFLTWLGQNTQSDVYYSQLSFASGDQITLTGNAKSEADVNQQVAIFEGSPEVQKVSVSTVGLSAASGLWQFTATLIINPSIFTATSTLP